MDPPALSGGAVACDLVAPKLEGIAVVDKITWQKAGRVAQPGRYMFTFGWLTVTAEDLQVWQQFPHAAFTLVPLPPRQSDAEPGDGAAAEEYHLGAFEIPPTGPSAHDARGEA